MLSTNSSTIPSQTPAENRGSEKELQRAFRLREGIRRLGFMLGVNSLRESLEWESQEVRRQSAIDAANIAGVEVATPANAEDADMGDYYMIAGAVLIGDREQPATQQAPAAPTPVATTPAATTPAATEVAKPETVTPADPVAQPIVPQPTTPVATETAKPAAVVSDTPATTTSTTTTTKRKWILPAALAAVIGIPAAAGGLIYALKPAPQTT